MHDGYKTRFPNTINMVNGSSRVINDCTPPNFFSQCKDKFLIFDLRFEIFFGFKINLIKLFELTFCLDNHHLYLYPCRLNKQIFILIIMTNLGRG
jgi:hypothetical protein